METKIFPATEKTDLEHQAEIAQRLAAHPFLHGLCAQHLQILAECALVTHFESGQVIFRAGEPANGFYLLESGQVVLEEPHAGGEPVVIDVVGAGEPLGWSWLFPPYLWQLNARATQPCRALCLPGILLRQHRDDDLFLSHELFKRTCEVMVRRLQAARRRLGNEKKSNRLGEGSLA
ncbi:MAG TPA: cyclic nucleotide-binding domain-containing protein [Chthoniobacterales bacterium]|jgi:CRP-like cAMP-binding protein